MKSKSPAPETEEKKPVEPPLDHNNSDKPSTEDDITGVVPEKTLVSHGIVITGNVVSEGELTVDGVIKGNIRAFIINLGSQAEVEGDLIGDSITVKGRVIGNIRGVDVKLMDGCEVRGNVLQEKLAIATGAVFEGRIMRNDGPNMDEPAHQEPLPEPAAPAPMPAATSPTPPPPLPPIKPAPASLAPAGQNTPSPSPATPPPEPPPMPAAAPPATPKKKAARKQSGGSEDASPVIVKDVAMIVGGQNKPGSKK